MQNTRTRRTQHTAATAIEAPTLRSLLRLSALWAYTYRKAVLLDRAVEQRIQRWGIGR